MSTAEAFYYLGVLNACRVIVDTVCYPLPGCTVAAVSTISRNGGAQAHCHSWVIPQALKGVVEDSVLAWLNQELVDGGPEHCSCATTGAIWSQGSLECTAVRRIRCRTRTEEGAGAKGHSARQCALDLACTASRWTEAIVFEEAQSNFATCQQSASYADVTLQHCS